MCYDRLPSLALIQSWDHVFLSASPRVAVVLVLVPEAWHHVVSLVNQPVLKTEVALRDIMALDVTSLVVL